MRGRGLGVLAVLAVALVLATPAPAGADPAEPTSDRSTVHGIDPPDAPLEARVVGGDAFLEVQVEAGREVTVPGYGGEPYLRFLPDGTVERNRRSPATYLNEDRLGGSTAPSDIDPDDEPVWEPVATGGTYVWHDHRIHWMSPDRPPGLEAGDVIDEWEVPLVVDGDPVTITGVLRWEEPISPLPWVALVAAVAAGTALVVRRSSGLVVAVASLIAGALAAGVAVAERSGLPSGAQSGVITVVVPLVAAAAGATAVGLGAVGRRAGATITTLLSVAATIGWVLLRVDVFTEPVLPTTLDPAIDRAGTAVAAGIAVAIAAVVAGSGALAPVAPVVGPSGAETEG
ncbi:MAG TPA: hypothetical protein DCS55_12155 [Acidimicrobiaceae bacterium]|nr:hypothetical protein [Acidimicrobiaceae bacterium]